MKATRAQVRQRVEEVLRIRLDGAEMHDIVQYAAEKGWGVGERQLWNYVRATDQLLAERLEKDRDKLLARHVAQRRALYARALNAADYRTALAVAKDEAELQGLYRPSVSVKRASDDAAYIDRELARLAAGGAGLPPGEAADGRAPPGAAGGPGPDLPPLGDGAGPLAGGGPGL
jgi:hypothetical protein